MNQAFRFTVTGRVQGVGFRAYVQSLAIRLDLRGEVWNTSHKEVEGMIQGEPDTILEFWNRLADGPGRVENISWIPVEASPIFEKFSVESTRF